MQSDEALTLLSDLIAKAKRAGADAADALFVEGISMSAAYRLGKPETVQRSEGGDIGVRVSFGKRQAMVSSSDYRPEALDGLVERALAMARTIPEDAYCGLAEPAQLAHDLPALDLADPVEPSPDELLDRAKRVEDAARAVPGVTNSEGGGADWGRTVVAMVASNGFANSYWTTSSQISAAVLAGDAASGMERDYDYAAAVHAADMRSPEDVGRRAGERTVRRLGARKSKSARLPVVYDPRVSRGILGHLVSAINGSGIARGTSFLKDSLGKQIFAKGIQVIDDPHVRRGLRSRPCDGEGVANRRRSLIEDGVLTTWLLDLRSGRQLNMQTTGHAARGTGSPPSPSSNNVWFEPGSGSVKELIADIAEGFYITELSGMGINGVTGDYSRGAAGFWIENGEILYPVNEVTVAGNLKDMFLNVSLANDLEFQFGMDAPTLRIDGMTIAGT